MIGITGASGQLGRLILDKLSRRIDQTQLVALVRNPKKGEALAAQGFQFRLADYDRPETLVDAFSGLTKVMLISGNEVGRRTPQHKAAIEAAKKAGVTFMAYTSILHADTSPLALAREHRETESFLKESGIRHALLRNGWYTENYTAGIPAAIKSGSLFGCAGAGKISSAAREDYAEAAAVVLSQEGQAGRVYELAGDDGYTLAQLAAGISQICGRHVAYKNLSEAEYAAVLQEAGLPGAFAQVLADSDSGASQGGLFDDSHQLSKLIGRPTTPLAKMIEMFRG